jgi:hypothetical protein
MSPRFMGDWRLSSSIVKRLVLSDSLVATGMFLSKNFWKAIPPEFHQDSLFWSWIS